MAPGLPTGSAGVLGEQRAGLIPRQLRKPAGAHPGAGWDVTPRSGLILPHSFWGKKGFPGRAGRWGLELLAVRSVRRQFPAGMSRCNGWSSSGDRLRMGINHCGSLSLPAGAVPCGAPGAAWGGHSQGAAGSLLEQRDPGGTGRTRSGGSGDSCKSSKAQGHSHSPFWILPWHWALCPSMP